ncbi:MAG: glycosyltransferase family 39 protein, partial [Anaerolineae bacterium]|nr:glycosyltransferase family 39 protein [Anaerolineae bacterium]
MPLAIFFVALIPRVLNLGAFITADEDDQIMFANLFLKSALQGDWTGALVLGYPGVPTLVLGAIGVGLRYWAHYAGWLPLAWANADLMTTLDQVTTRFGSFEYPLDFLLWVRWPMALTAALCVVGIFLLTRRLLGRPIALLTALIIAFDPFILAHSRVIHVDAPLAYFMFLSFLAFLLYLDKGDWKWLLLSGLFGGLAGLSKTPAALLGPILVVSGLFYALFPAPGQPRAIRWKRLGLALLGWGGIAAAAFFVMFPSMWADPLQTIWRLVHNVISVNETAHPTTGIFWGEQQSDQNPLYYLIVFPYHLTPLTTIGSVVGVLMILVALVTRWRIITGATGDIYKMLMRNLPLSMGLVVYVVMFIAPVSAISRRGDRYILPVYFATGLLTALALWWLASLVRKYLPGLLHRLRLTPFRLVG